MIHFITVHYRTDVWIPLQLRYLRKFVASDYRVHASFTGTDPGRHHPKFETVLHTKTIDHGEKLDQLAAQICASADPSDVLVFIDSDAFPVARLDRLIDELKTYPLIAVRRDENAGDRQPHPCFCMTTVGFWQSLGGNWGKDHAWPNIDGALVKDVGGNLLKLLTDQDILWKPLLRTNTVNVHPLMFGIYDHVIYHHAAGSRRPTIRQDKRRTKLENANATPAELKVLGDRVLKSNQALGKRMLTMIRLGINPIVHLEPRRVPSVLFHRVRQLIGVT